MKIKSYQAFLNEELSNQTKLKISRKDIETWKDTFQLNYMVAEVIK